MTIVPAILTNNKNELMRMLNTCREFTDFVQVDIMDGKFVPSVSVTIEDLKGIKSPLRCEAHLMVNEPLDWISCLKDFGAEKIIFHFEIDKDKIDILNRIKKAGLKTGLAINPDTPIKEFSALIDKVDSILFMSVIPGFYGSKFIPEVLDKVKEFNSLYPRKETEIDGGVKLSNLDKIKEAGLDYICVGSAILKAPSPSKAYEDFLKRRGRR